MTLRFSVEDAVARGWIKADQTPAPSPLGDGPEENRKQASGRVDREGPEQVSVLEWMEAAHPELAPLLMHIPNGGKRTRMEAFLFIKQGVRKGVPDLFLPVARHGYHGLWIEMKAPPEYSSSLRADQKVWLNNLRDQGYATAVSKGRDPAITIIDSYLSPTFHAENLLWTKR